jgi:shikimate kinase
LSPDPASISKFDLPYKNLVLTGVLGVGKTTIGRHIARQLGVSFLDVDEEIELRELMSIAKIRELYGDSRLRSLEYDFCRQGALMRRSVIVTSGAALLDARNFNALTDTGLVVVLACEMGEALRRLHLTNSKLYRDKTIRGRMMSRLRRERQIVDNPELLQLDTTHLTIEEETDLLIRFWAAGEPGGEHFRYGPAPPIRPPSKSPVGISGWRQGGS